MKQVNYNEVSRIYDDVREADIVLIEHFLSELPEEDGLNVLDLGCGTGNFTDLFQGLVQGRACRLYGIDPSEGMIARAQSKNDQVFFRQGTARKHSPGGRFLQLRLYDGCDPPRSRHSGNVS